VPVRCAQADDRELAELENQAVLEKEAAEQAEAELARAQSRSRQKRAEIEAAKAQLRSLAEALEPSDQRREVFEQFMQSGQLREHAASELQVHSGMLRESQVKLDAARQHLEDLPAEAGESTVGPTVRIDTHCPPTCLPGLLCCLPASFALLPVGLPGTSACLLARVA
jgi:multidrug efflux pump subunit AcrA (membrane-fusion protein)